MTGKRTVPRVRFLAPYIYTPSTERRVSTKYKAGAEGPVTAECAERAIAAGVAELIKPEKPNDAIGEAPGTSDVFPTDDGQ